MKNILVLLVALMLAGCSSSENSGIQGKWRATWETDPSAYEGIEGITDFTMPGEFIFKEERLNIKAYGFEGCVFNRDTLDHELMWKITGDSLVLINDDAVPGMVYQIKLMSKNEIKLQLMEDISLTLTR